MKGYGGEKGNHPLTAHLDHCNFIHYSIQLHTYRYVLEQYYGKIVDPDCYMVVLHPNQTSFECIKCRDVREEVVEIMEQRRYEIMDRYFYDK
jgi:hypothetical protein